MAFSEAPLLHVTHDGVVNNLCLANDLQLWKLLMGREVESGLGKEALQKAGPVLHPPEPGLHQRDQLIDTADQAGAL